MIFSSEGGGDLVEPTSAQLEAALAKLGLPGNGYATLAREEQHYIQTAGSRADGYIVEFREGGEEKHYFSKNKDIPYHEMVSVFLAYQGGGDWRTLIEWDKNISSGSGNGKSNTRISASHKWLLISFFTIGIASISTGVCLIVETERFLYRAVAAPGKVVTMIQNGVGGTFSPIVEYTDKTGQNRTLRTSQGSRPPSFYVGEAVVVLYDPEDVEFPLNAKIRSFSSL